MAGPVRRRPPPKDDLEDFMVFEETGPAPGQHEAKQAPVLPVESVPPIHKAESVQIIPPTEDRPVPPEWSNGSAVMAEGAEPHGWPLCKRYEEVDGLLGRIEKEAGLYHVWGWLPESKTYRYKGATDDVPASFKLLHDEIEKGRKSAKAEPVVAKPEKRKRVAR